MQSTNYPDLIPGTIHSNTPTGNETRVCAGAAPTFSTNVTNIGAASAGTFSVIWYVKNSTNATIRGPVPGSPPTLGPLAPAQRQLSNYTALLPTTGSPTNFTVGIFVDPTNQVNEGPNGKNNNRSERVISVFNWPACSTTLQLKPVINVAHIAPGEKAIFTIQVKLTHGLPQQVTLSIDNNQTVISGLQLRNITFSPTSMMVNTSKVVTSSLIIQTTTNTPPRNVNYTITVRGSTSTNTTTTDVLLDVGDPLVVAKQGVVQGRSITTTLHVRVHGNVTLSYTIDFQNSSFAQTLFGVNLTFNPTKVQLPTANKEAIENLTINTSLSTVARNYRVLIIAQGSQVNGNGTLNLQVIPRTDFFVLVKEESTHTTVCVVPSLNTNEMDCKVSIFIYSGGSYNGTIQLSIDAGTGLTNLQVCTSTPYNAASCKSSQTYHNSYYINSTSNGKPGNNWSIVLYLFFSAAKGVYTIDISTAGTNPISYNSPGPVELSVVVTKGVTGAQLSITQLLFASTIALFALVLGRRRSHAKSRQAASPSKFNVHSYNTLRTIP